MEELHSWWEVPNIAHFFNLFHSVLKLPDIQIEALEEALLDDGSTLNGSPVLYNLIVSLLLKCYPRKDLTCFNFQTHLCKLFAEQDSQIAINPDVSFQSFSLRKKVEILYALCHYALDADEVDIAKKIDSDMLRLRPIGYDNRKSAYWYFYGTRLYREDFSRKRKSSDNRKNKINEKKKSVQNAIDAKGNESTSVSKWQVVCSTESDWEKVTKSFLNSTSKDEQALYSVLSEDYLPKISKIFIHRHNLLKKQMLMSMPRRISSRIEIIKRQALEEKSIEKKVNEEASNRQEEDKKSQELLRKDRGLRLKLRTLAANKSSPLKEQHSKNSLVEGTLRCSFRNNQDLPTSNIESKPSQLSSKVYQNGFKGFSPNEVASVVAKPLSTLNSLPCRWYSIGSTDHTKRTNYIKEVNDFRRSIESENILPY